MRVLIPLFIAALLLTSGSKGDITGYGNIKLRQSYPASGLFKDDKPHEEQVEVAEERFFIIEGQLDLALNDSTCKADTILHIDSTGKLAALWIRPELDRMTPEQVTKYANKMAKIMLAKYGDCAPFSNSGEKSYIFAATDKEGDRVLMSWDYGSDMSLSYETARFAALMAKDTELKANRTAASL